ncbi:transposase, MuDR, MULE transposase domain protein, partial [Tanacetum coccineum]
FEDILDLALQFDNACTIKEDLRKAYEKCNHIPQESRVLIDTFLKEKIHEIGDVYLTAEELHQLHLDEEALRETQEEQTMDEKAREEKIRQKQADDDEYFMEFGVVQLSNSICVEPSSSTPNPVRIIPGPASLVRRAKLLKENVFILDPDGALMSTQEYMHRKLLRMWEKLKQVVAIVKSCSLNALGDLNVTLKDLSGTIPGTIHYKVLDVSSYEKDIIVGAAMIFANVSVFTPKPSKHYLNITKRNMVEVFRKDTVSLT